MPHKTNGKGVQRIPKMEELPPEERRRMRREDQLAMADKEWVADFRARHGMSA